MIVWRSGLLAAWGTSFLSGTQPLDEVIDKVIGEDVQRVNALPIGSSTEGQDLPLSWALTELKQASETRLHAVFPSPGDPCGLPPGPVATAALTAGEAVVAPSLQIVLIPFEDSDEQLDVTWQCFSAEAKLEEISPAEADFDLAEAMMAATARLTDLDVASWNPDRGRVALHHLREAQTDILPHDFPPRAGKLLLRASKLVGVLDVAHRDANGGAINSYESQARAQALAPLSRAVRRAMMAGYNAAPRTD